MVRWSPPNPPPTPQATRWQSRAEILKKHLDTLSPEELRQVRPDYYWLHFGHDAWKREQARKYDPNQPRVPAGDPDGGQWTSGDGASGQANFQRTFAAATKLAARKPTMNQCIDLCLPLLLRPQKPGRDYNQMDFRKCINACLGRLGQ